jgi:hypothetical protein
MTLPNGASCFKTVPKKLLESDCTVPCQKDLTPLFLIKKGAGLAFNTQFFFDTLAGWLGE